jgi:hypothetical protein
MGMLFSTRGTITDCLYESSFPCVNAWFAWKHDSWSGLNELNAVGLKERTYYDRGYLAAWRGWFR